MAVPDSRSFMLPLLRLAADGEEHTLAEARETLAAQLGLSDADRAELLPSGRQTRLANRVAWAKIYLCQAGLLASQGAGRFRITERGREVLRDPPARIDDNFLRQYPEFVESKTGKAGTRRTRRAQEPATKDRGTPEEALEEAEAEMRARLASDLLARVKSSAPSFFERVVVDLLVRMGYGHSGERAGEVVGRSGDGGIDGIISQDRLGLDVVYVQAKRWDGTVGRPEVQKFVGALHGRRAKKGVFVTTGVFSDEAAAYVRHLEPRVVLIDGRRLAELMIDFDVGVSTVRTVAIKRADSDYFEEG